MRSSVSVSREHRCHRGEGPQEQLISRRESLGLLAGLAFSFVSHGEASAQEPAKAHKELAHKEISLSAFLPKIPQAFGELAVKHIDKILEAGYGKFLHPDDFDHGHIVWKKGQRYAKSFLEGKVDAVAMVLYHTAESTQRWSVQEAELPIEKRTPRSILGYPDGSIKPAAEVLDIERLEKLRTYRERGTIFETDLHLQIEGLEPMRWPQDSEHAARGQFSFGLHKEGRFTTKAGKIEAQFSQYW